VALTDDTRVRVESPGPSSGPSGAYDRTPPQDIAAERSVLGGMMMSKDAIADVIETVRSADFYRPAHQLVFDAITDLYGRGEPADAITVSNELVRTGQIARVGGADYLITLIQTVPTAANAPYYAQIVAERATLRRLVMAGTRIVQMGYDTASGTSDIVGSIDDVVDRAQAAIYDVTERRTAEDFVHIETLMQGTMDEIDRISATGGIGTGIPTGFARLDEITNGLHAGQMITVAGRPGSGKALALDTPLPTPTGWTTMGAIQVGEQLLGADGRPTTVVAAAEVMTGRPCYEVEFSDGTTIVADAHHQWLTTTRAMRRAPASEQRARASIGAYGRAGTSPLSAAIPGEVVTTEEIAATLRCATADQRLNHAIECTRPLELPEAELPLPPYTLGIWLGDGTSASASLTTADEEVVHAIRADGIRVEKLAATMRFSLRYPESDRPERTCEVCGRRFVPAQQQVRTCGQSCGGKVRFRSGPVAQPTCPDCGRRTFGWRRCAPCHAQHGTVQGRLRTLGVLGNKHIPVAYLRASVSQRRALLAGLLDSDGTVNKTGNVSFAVTDRRLAEDFRELVVSLGYRASLQLKPVRGRTEESSTCYTVSFTPAEVVFVLPRKVERQRSQIRASTRNRYITAVRAIESVPVRCVQVDNADHLYLAGRTMIPTHNSTLALDFARSAAIKNQKPTVIFSLEMGKLELMMRLFSAEASVPLRNMRSGHMADQDWTRMARRAGELAEAPLFLDDSPNLTMMEIRAKSRRLKQRHDLQMIVIDYMQLMTSGKRVESRQQEVSEFSRAIKLLAKELEVPVIALSQLNRGPEQRTDKKPMLSDLRESGSIEQDSDMVLLVHREDMYERESPRAGEADLIIAKHRNGPTATIQVAFQGHLSRFMDMPD
jgi:replicative DNA helicase